MHSLIDKSGYVHYFDFSHSKRLLGRVAVFSENQLFMLLPRLREEVLEANLELVRRGLVLYTFGNASGISREQKPGRHQAQWRSLREDETGASGGHRSGRQDRRRRFAAVLRPSHSSCALSGLSGNRRRGSHPFRIRHFVGAGAPADSMLWHHPCRLLSWPGSGHRADDGQRNCHRV